MYFSTNRKTSTDFLLLVWVYLYDVFLLVGVVGRIGRVHRGGSSEAVVFYRAYAYS